MRILVTGGAGFVGANLVRELVRRQNEVVVFDNLSLTTSLAHGVELDPRVRFVHGDVRQRDDLKMIPSGSFDTIYHLAAAFANERSLVYPEQDLLTNAYGTLSVIAFAKDVGCGNFVYAGSSSSYGAARLPFLEDSAMDPTTPYAATKLLGERYVTSSGLANTVFRLFNVYGPGDPPGEFRNAIPNMAACISTSGRDVQIFGAEATRDFTYVDDVVSVLVDARLAVGRTVNIGSGVETRILDLGRLLLELLREPDSRLVHVPKRSWDKVSRRVADTGLLQNLFPGACRTPLRVGLAPTLTWLKRSGFLAGMKS